MVTLSSFFFVNFREKGGSKWQKTRKQKLKTEEQVQHQKPDGILTKKINGKTFVTEICFDKKSKETFQDKLFKVIHSNGE